MSKAEKFNYTSPSGFDIEFLPGEKRLEQHFLDTLRRVFELYGFTPIETPAVERLEVLQAKGQQGDNIIYGISPLVANAEDGELDRALKFDQTVPLAAYIARHLNDLVFPFARYQMDMVFRGERAKAGRYRQFRQCDIDIVGRGKLDLLYDAQMPAIISEIFTQLNIGAFRIRINNRKVLTGFFTAIGIAPDLARTCINIVDELDKIGATKVQAQLEAILIERGYANGVSADQGEKIIAFTQIQGSPDEILSQLAAMFDDSAEEFHLGVRELAAVIAGVRSLQVPEDNFCIDLAIARGLGYYTGTVYETTLIGYESLGSICSGGRYAELVGIFAGEQMPGVGISIGLTRLIKNLLKEKIVQPLPQSTARVAILNMDASLVPSYLSLAQQLRGAGIGTIVNLDASKMSDQFKKAEKIGIEIAIIQGTQEQANQSCQVKVLATREQREVAIGELVATLQELLLS
jgi:histidyl-tRNA synthetase